MVNNYWLIHVPKVGGTSLRVSGIAGEHKEGYKPDRVNILLIRNPLDRTLSHFKENVIDEQVKLSSWFTKNFYDYQTNYLIKYLKLDSLESIKKFILENKIIVIPTDKLNEGMKRLGLKSVHLNKARRNYFPTKEEISLIKEHNKLDNDLYNFVCYLFEINRKS